VPPKHPAKQLEIDVVEGMTMRNGAKAQSMRIGRRCNNGGGELVWCSCVIPPAGLARAGFQQMCGYRDHIHDHLLMFHATKFVVDNA
jgi:hypothetical protein